MTNIKAIGEAEVVTYGTDAVVKKAEDEVQTTTGSDTLWDGFTRNLDKMGLGMLGIFVVIGIIIIVTSLLSKIKSKDAE